MPIQILSMNHPEALKDPQSFFPGFPAPAPTLNDAELQERIARIDSLLKARDAVLVAHYYTADAVQIAADRTGGYVSDSLDMARFGHEHAASTLVVAGVRFMGETAKILNPEKTVLMPTLEATCSLDLGCPVEEFSAFCDAHPDRTVVVYANTSAAVKARADWVVTSSCALQIVSHLMERGEKILWAPDRYLGDYIRRQTGADMLLWEGACIVHEEFKAEELRALMQEHPQAKVLVHPESPPGVIGLADVVGSTSALIRAVRELDAQSFIVATDRGIFHKMHEAAPDKELIEAPTAGRSATCRSCAHCPWMAMNQLDAVIRTLETGAGEVLVDPAVGRRAMLPIKRMLDFNAQRHATVYGAGDA